VCGIAGLLDPTARLADPEAVLNAMQRCLSHRGPDDSGVWFDRSQRVGLAHRRLAIVDLSPLGHQPMSSASGRFTIVFNGEIYNFPTLRAELESSGARFRGHSDTEVMLAAFERWGIVESTGRFAGMFAFALWDRETRALTLGRDRVGKKPLSFGWIGPVFAFASELGSFRALPDFTPEVDRAALIGYLRHSCVPGPLSIHPALRKLPPGCLAALDGADLASGARPLPVETAYWSARAAVSAGRRAPFAGSPEQAVDALDAVLGPAVAERMVADVPLGAFLSGGIDSSLVVALMQAQSSRPVRTFTIGFEEANFNEATHARAVAAHLGTEHTELALTPGAALDVVPRLSTIFDEPFADSSQIPTFLVSSLARQHVTVALSGDGGDELFGGYNRHRFGDQLWRWAAPLPRAARRGTASLLRAVRPSTWDRAAGIIATLSQRRLPPAVGAKVHKLATLLCAQSIGELYQGFVSIHDDPASLVVGGAATTRSLEESHARTDERALEARARESLMLEAPLEMMLLDLERYLVDDILVKVDRASMAVSLEARAPLLDHRVVEFAWTLPRTLRIRNGVGKWPLRELLSRHVPRALFERPKQGFGVPMAKWLAGPLRPWAEALLSETALRQDGMLEIAPVRKLWSEFLAGRTDRWEILWALACYRQWADAWRSGVPRTP